MATMDETEAKAYILLQHIGCVQILFEPNGQRTPDFSCEPNTAIEVSRLTKSKFIEGKTIVIDSDVVAIRQSISNAIRSFDGRACERSQFVNYRIRRPYQKREIVSSLKIFLEEILRSDFRPNGDIPLCGGFIVDITDATTRTKRPFLEGAHMDHDRTGWSVPDLTNNITRIASLKAEKARRSRTQYTQWWLVLENRLTLRVSAENLAELSISSLEFWDSCIVFDPRDPRQYSIVFGAGGK